LSALTIANIIPKRFVLQTGGKHYALHLGPTAIPQTEGLPSDRVPHSNFYFPQEDLLATWAEKHHTKWIVTRPGFILGANPTAFINIAYALALYASIQKELGQKLDFPADIVAWDINKDNTTARLIGYFSEWVILSKGTENEAFNLVDDSPFSYGAFWPEVASWYGLSASLPESDESKYQTITLPMSPPPRGFGGPGVVKITFSFEEWSQRAEVKAAWEKVRERGGLVGASDPWAKGNESTLKNIFATLDAEILGGWARTQTMDKAKALGWHGHVRTADGFKDTIEKMAGLKMVPKY
jgi:nucleoside-diphosphate-sugar epimerase